MGQDSFQRMRVEQEARAKYHADKDRDTRRIGRIERNTLDGKRLTRDELIALYLTKAERSLFDTEEDPRVDVRAMRNSDEDMLAIFECEKGQVARSLGEIDRNTKAYVGPINAEVFERLSPGVDYVFSSFPEGRIRRGSLEIGGMSEPELEDALARDGFEVTDSAVALMRSGTFATGHVENVHLVRLRVHDLGFTERPTTAELFARAVELGFALCPTEVGAYYRLQSVDQPMRDQVYVGMPPAPEGDPQIFHVSRDEGKPALRTVRTRHVLKWRDFDEFLFRIPDAENARGE